VRRALRLIAEAVGSMPRQVAPDRFLLVTREPEGQVRVTFASRLALLHIAARVRLHNERWESAHFYERWNGSDKFRL
jgi:hypothetical protein